MPGASASVNEHNYDLHLYAVAIVNLDRSSVAHLNIDQATEVAIDYVRAVKTRKAARQRRGGPRGGVVKTRPIEKCVRCGPNDSGLSFANITLYGCTQLIITGLSAIGIA